MGDLPSEMRNIKSSDELRRKYKNGLQTIAHVVYPTYTYKTLVFPEPKHVTKIWY